MKKETKLIAIILLLTTAVIVLLVCNNHQYYQMQKTIAQKEERINELKKVEVKVIKSYILDELELSEEEVKIFDVNKDGKVSALDYVELKNKLEDKDT